MVFEVENYTGSHRGQKKGRFAVIDHTAPRRVPVTYPKKGETNPHTPLLLFFGSLCDVIFEACDGGEKIDGGAVIMIDAEELTNNINGGDAVSYSFRFCGDFIYLVAGKNILVFVLKLPIVFNSEIPQHFFGPAVLEYCGLVFQILVEFVRGVGGLVIGGLVWNHGGSGAVGVLLRAFGCGVLHGVRTFRA